MRTLFAVAILAVIAGCATQPVSEACRSTDDKGNKSSECAGAMGAQGLGAALDGLRALDLVTIIAR